MLHTGEGHLTRLSVPKALVAARVNELSNFLPVLLPAVH